MINRSMHKLYPPFRQAMYRILGYSNMHGCATDVFETERNGSRQSQLFGKGASSIKVSRHQLSIACDIYPVKESGLYLMGIKFKHWFENENGTLTHNGKVLQNLAHQNKIEWGGDWDSTFPIPGCPGVRCKDYAHFQWRLPSTLPTNVLYHILTKHNMKSVWQYLKDYEENEANSENFFGGEAE